MAMASAVTPARGRSAQRLSSPLDRLPRVGGATPRSRAGGGGLAGVGVVGLAG